MEPDVTCRIAQKKDDKCSLVKCKSSIKCIIHAIHDRWLNFQLRSPDAEPKEKNVSGGKNLLKTTKLIKMSEHQTIEQSDFEWIHQQQYLFKKISDPESVTFSR